jgi:hypothetical protein
MTYVVPPAPVEGDDLDDVLQALVVGITGLDGDLVRPRWQVVDPKTGTAVPKRPEPTVDWCAIGVTTSTPDANPYVEHLSGISISQPAGDRSQRHEDIEVFVSFYGPNAKANLGILRDGLWIEQNQYAAKASGLYFTGQMETGRAAPEFINQQWIRRWDSALTFRRMVARAYLVNNIVSAEIDLKDDTGHVDRVVNVPPDGR